MLARPKGVIEGWLRDIEDAAEQRVGIVRSHWSEHHGSGAISPEAGDDIAERLFGALAFGEPGLIYARDRRRWVSWIENNPPYLWLSASATVCVDLVPCASLEEFANVYGCLPEQFAALMSAHPGEPVGPLFVNLRSDDSLVYAADGVRETLGPVLQVAERMPERFYRLQRVRAAAFEMLGINWKGAEDAGREFAKEYTLPGADAAKHVEGALHLTNRAGIWPPAGQVANRIAYYLAAQQLVSRGLTQGISNNILERHFSQYDPLPGAEDPRGLVRVLAHLYLHHHLVTAPITGALGGGYAMLAREVDQATSFLMDETAFDEVLKPRAELGRVGLARWIHDLQIGRAVRGREHTAKALRRLPNEGEWDHFLANERSTRASINLDEGVRREDAYARIQRIAGELGGHTRPFFPEEEEQIVAMAADEAGRGGISAARLALPVLTLGGALVAGAVAGPAGAAVGAGVGAAAGTTHAGSSLLASLPTFCDALGKLKEGLAGFDRARPFCDWLDGTREVMCKRRLDKIVVDRFAGGLRPS